MRARGAGDEQRLPDREHAGDDGDGDHRRDEHGEQSDVLVGDCDVEDFPQQECGHGAEHGGDEDQRADRCEPEPVGPEKPHDPAGVRLAHGRIGRTLRRILR
jgi:hypothetical protein